MTRTIQELLSRMVHVGASDLHVKAGNKPGFRVDGELRTAKGDEVLTPEVVQGLAEQLMSTEQLERFDASHNLDFSHEIAGLARFRVAVLRQRAGVGMVIRQIPGTVPTIEDLKLPAVCAKLCNKPRGLVLVTGPTGSGKSTTLAAMVNHINGTRRGHIVTLEDPIEFVHQDDHCFVTQREVGTNAGSFQDAIRQVLRQDPDVILVGEMRDKETIELALTAAETGHLVLATLHTSSAAGAVNRIVDVFPPDGQQQIRVQLSSTLQGVVAQCLLAATTGGRVAAREILVATDAVRAMIREGRTTHLLNAMQTGADAGMHTLENELFRLVEKEAITPLQALATANRPTDVLGSMKAAGITCPELAKVTARSSRTNGSDAEVEEEPTRQPIG